MKKFKTDTEILVEIYTGKSLEDIEKNNEIVKDLVNKQNLQGNNNEN